MKAIFILPFLFLTGWATAQIPEPSVLIGEWKVDLRPTPLSAPYFQRLVITELGDRTFKGTFYYDSEIKEARINRDWEELTIAFITEDGTGAYNTVARLEGDILKGTTHSIGRDFLSIWSAEKVD